MKDQDATEELTEKDARSLPDSQADPAQEPGALDPASKELTDEDFAKVTGGITFQKITWT
jgi:hypothetical protein